MLNLHTDTKLTPKEVVESAVAFFGPEGIGLEVKERGENSAYFEGGGGGVEVVASVEGSGSAVDLETREWEYQTKDFARRIKTA